MEIVDYIGNKDILKLHKTAFFCSRKIISSIVLECYDWAIEQRNKGNCVISGFHSAIEKDVFHFLAKGNQPIIMVLHKGLKENWEPEIQKLLDANRLLIITPFDKSVKWGSEETGKQRNQFTLSLAKEIKVGYISPGGNLGKLGLYNK
jgi:hypothetical protein